jgi:ribose transport system ATP-binding protein
MSSTTDIGTILTVTNVSKTFPGTKALDSVSMQLSPGRIYGLVGHNGSGKSTLIKILTGYHPPDAGAQATYCGTEVDLRSPGGEWRHNLHAIHQELGLIPRLSAMENLALLRGSYARGRFGQIDWKEEGRRASAILTRYGMEADVKTLARDLTVQDATIVAMAAALDGTSDEAGAVLILDEPTAKLAEREVRVLFRAIRKVADAGCAVVFVSHRLHEVLGLCDHVIALRNGKLVADQPTAGLDHDALVNLIVGGQVSEYAKATSSEVGRGVLLGVRGLAGGTAKEVDFDLHEGEILGITGVPDSGREAVTRILHAEIPRTAGTTTVRGRVVSPRSPQDAIAAGFALVPADRYREALVARFSVRENLTLPSLRGSVPPLRLSIGKERKSIRRWMELLQIQPPDPEVQISSLSGGNAQKVVIGRWLMCSPTILMLEEPAAGVDVGAKASIFEYIGKVAAEGIGVIMSSQDETELAAVADRVLVFREGRVAAELSGDALTADAIAKEVLKEPTGDPEPATSGV